MAGEFDDFLGLMEWRRSQPERVDGGSILPGNQALASPQLSVRQSLRVRRFRYGLRNVVCNRRFTERGIIYVGQQMQRGAARSQRLRVRRNSVVGAGFAVKQTLLDRPWLKQHRRNRVRSLSEFLIAD